MEERRIAESFQRLVASKQIDVCLDMDCTSEWRWFLIMESDVCKGRVNGKGVDDAEVKRQLMAAIEQEIDDALEAMKEELEKE